MIEIQGNRYELLKDYKNGWDEKAFQERYSEVLRRYDFIVGDWGYDQLRLKGFFHERHPKASKGSSIQTLQDYLHEYCNFDCPYFVLKKIDSPRRRD